MAEPPQPDRLHILTNLARAVFDDRPADAAPSEAPQKSLGVTVLGKRIDWLDMAVLLASEGVGLPLAAGAGHVAVVDGEWSKAIIGWVLGLPLMVLGGAFPFLNESIKTRIGRIITAWLLPLVLIAAFVWIVGPFIFEHVTNPRPTSIAPPTAKEIANAVAPTQQTPGTITWLPPKRYYSESDKSALANALHELSVDLTDKALI
jgi:hypothetical protein